MTKFLSIALVVIVAAFVVYEAKETPKVKTTESASISPIDSDLPELIDSDVAPTIARAPSSDYSQQQAVIDQMTNIILSISSKDEVIPKVKEVLQVAEKADPNKQLPGVQLLAGYMKVLPGLEGIIYRGRAVVEPSDWMHMSALVALRSFRYNNYLYGKHVLAIFDFMTIPSTAAGAPFTSVTDFQGFLMGRVTPVLKDLLATATSMESLPQEAFNFKLDRRLFIGINDGIRFLDPNETVKQFMKPYLYSVEFALQRTLGTIYYASTLEANDLPAISSEILAATTINEFRGKLRKSVGAAELAKGFTPLIAFNVLNRHPDFFKFKDLTFKGANGQPTTYKAQDMLNRSYDYFMHAAYYELAAFNCVIEMGVTGKMGATLRDCEKSDNQDYSSQYSRNGRDFMFNPDSLLLDYRINKAALVQRWELFKGSRTLTAKDAAAANGVDPGKFVTMTSEVTGQNIRLNVRALFNAQNAPRNFFPSAFTKAANPTYTSSVGGYGWNYDHGKPTAYGRNGDFTFGGFFEPTEVRDLASMEKAMTTLVYTRSTSNFAVLLPVPSPVSIAYPQVDTFTVNQ